MFSLDSGTSILKKEILATPQSTLITLNQSLLKNNLQPPYELLSSSFLLFTQLQSLIWTFYTKTFFQLSLVTQSLQNISPQMANHLWTQMVLFFLITESIYHLLVISIHAFSSIIMIIFLLDTSVKTKYQDQFAVDIPGPASMLIYNNSISPISLVYNLSHNITSLIDLSNNFLFLNDYGIPFLQTSLRNFHHSPDLILSWSQSTGSPSRQSLSLSMMPSYLFILHVFSKHSIPSYITSNRGSGFVSNFFCSLDTAVDIQLHFTSGYHPKGDGQTEHMNQALK